jgi:hypothetical protein
MRFWQQRNLAIAFSTFSVMGIFKHGPLENVDIRFAVAVVASDNSVDSSLGEWGRYIQAISFEREMVSFISLLSEDAVPETTGNATDGLEWPPAHVSPHSLVRLFHIIRGHGRPVIGRRAKGVGAVVLAARERGESSNEKRRSLVKSITKVQMPQPPSSGLHETELTRHRLEAWWSDPPRCTSSTGYESEGPCSWAMSAWTWTAWRSRGWTTHSAE